MDLTRSLARLLALLEVAAYEILRVAATTALFLKSQRRILLRGVASLPPSNLSEPLKKERFPVGLLVRRVSLGGVVQHTLLLPHLRFFPFEVHFLRKLRFVDALRVNDPLHTTACLMYRDVHKLASHAHHGTPFSLLLPSSSPAVLASSARQLHQ